MFLGKPDTSQVPAWTYSQSRANRGGQGAWLSAAIKPFDSSIRIKSVTIVLRWFRMDTERFSKLL